MSLDWTALEAQFVELQRQLGRAAERLRAPGNPAPGGSPRELLASHGKARLYRYLPPSGKRPSLPLLIVYALVNRPTMADLEPGRSLVHSLLERGIDVHLLEWEDPGVLDASRDLGAYITQDLHACVSFLETRLGAVNLMGICQGGTFALCYAALEPQRVRTLITTVTPADFQTPDDHLSRLLREVDLDLLGAGNVSGDALNALFLRLRPYRLLAQKYVDLLPQFDDPLALATFLRMERWIFDSPDLAGRALAEFARKFYRENRFRQGGLEIGGRLVDLASVKVPVLNIYATEDHLVPPAASRALAGLTGSPDYTEVAVPGGHIGIYVGSSARATVAEAIAGWLRKRTGAGRGRQKSSPEDRSGDRSSGEEGRSNGKRRVPRRPD